MTEGRIYLYIRKRNGKRGFAPAAFAKNRRILPQHALVGGAAELHPEATYYLRYTSSGKQVYEAVGKDPQAAVVARLRKEHLLQARASGAVVESNPGTQRLAVALAIERFMGEKSAHRSAKTFVLAQFLKSLRKRYIDEVAAETCWRSPLN